MKKIMTALKTAIVAMACLFICTGCLLSDLDNQHVSIRYESGVKAMDAGDFETASQLFYRAYRRSDTYGVDPRLKAACAYNLAICTGQLGRLEQAENWFKGTMVLDEKYEGKDGPLASGRWLNLARLYSAEGKNTSSVEAYENGIRLFEKHGIDKTQPVDFAVVLEEYATVLKKSGSDAKADATTARARQIRADHPDETAKAKFYTYPSKPI